jgi:hypothetical protein
VLRVRVGVTAAGTIETPAEFYSLTR